MQRLKSLRILKRMSRKSLALKIGISESTLAAYEQGIREPNIERLIVISKLFNVSLDYLLENDRPTVNTIVPKSFTPGEKLDIFISQIKREIKDDIRKELFEEIKEINKVIQEEVIQEEVIQEEVIQEKMDIK